MRDHGSLLSKSTSREAFDRTGKTPGNGLIQQRFLAQAARNPESVAISYEDVAYTYGEIDAKSRAVAYQLHAIGLRAGQRIAILADRSPELVWSMLGVLRLGGVFIVLDSAYPTGRLQALLEVAAPNVLIAAGAASLQNKADELGAAVSIPVWIMDDVPPPPTASEFMTDQCSPHDPAYFIFTSGSTGKPKAVACSHVPLRHFVGWHSSTFGFTAEDRFTMLSGLSHDPLLRDIFTPLSVGATLAIPRQATITQPGALRSWCAQVRATVTHLTPAMGQLLAAGASQAPSLPWLRYMFWGGDKLLPRLLEEVSAFAPAAQHINFYGCSETPQAAAYFRFDGSASGPSVPIGRGTDGFTLRVLNGARLELSPGETGEIAISSRFLSLGYVENGVIQPAHDVEEQTYYTGDRGYCLPDGNIVLIGRSDDQIKIRGFRVELAEVTNTLLEHPGVLSGIALALHRDTRPTIGAFIAVKAEATDCEVELRAFLAAQLPGYMLPERIWIFAGHLPLLPNGKIDRRTLQAQAELDSAREASKPDEATVRPLTDAEADLVKRWEDVFVGAKVTIHDTFSSLGGDSLSYVSAYLATEDVLGTVPVDWANMSVARLAASHKRQNKWFSSIDSFMVLRAVAITLIVAYHFNLANWGDGFTGALFVVSGFLFGGMQLKEVFNGRSVSRILVSAKNILFPTAAFVALTCVIDLARHHLPPLNTVLLSSDLVSNPTEFARLRHDVIFWYVDALMQILLLIFLLVSIVPPRFRTTNYLIRFSFALFAAGCAVKFGLPILTDPGFRRVGAPELSLEQLSPIGNFATFMLGVLLATVSDRAKYLLFAAALTYAGLDAHFYGMANALSIAGAVVLLTFWRRVTLPRPVANLAFIISGASLFIYLSHLLFGYGTNALFHGHLLLLQLGIALLGGVCVQKLWQGAVLRFSGTSKVVRSA
jgi:amino acid adenylation domain-containing protein